MKLYLVERTGECDYDEYDSFIVRAKNENEAIEICNDKLFKKELVKITELTNKGKSEIILGSYNAG